MTGRTLLAIAAVPVLAVAADPGALEFHRVHVPAGRIADVPLGDARYVPMPLADFEAAVTRARAAAGAAAVPVPPATAARWRAAVDESGALAGTISCDVGPATAGPGRVLPLGELRVRRAVLGGEPPREALVCGTGAGLALAIPEPGTYELEFSCAPEAAGTAAFRLPLVPSLVTSLTLDLPAGTRPALAGPAARHAVIVPAAAGPWRIELGPAADVRIAVEPRDRPPPAVAVWEDVALSGPRAEFAAAVVPATPWRMGRIVLEQDPTLRVTGMHAADDPDPLDHQTAADGRTLSVTVPRWLDGRRDPLVVRGVAPATGPVWRLPLLRPPAGAWAGGGSIVRLDPAFVVRDVEVEEGRIVPPETAASWPVPDRGALRAAAYHVEQQGPASTVGIEIGPRSPSFDVARVTTVDISPGTVLGRASCDVRVTGGEAFEITGRVAPGWIIDAVDAVDWSAATEEEDPATARGPADRALDWRVVSAPAGDVLRIGLAVGASGRRGIGLRIAGHRAGLAPGAAFTTSDIDMVRFDGDAPDGVVIDLRTGADAFIEIAGRAAGWFEVEGRLAPLATEGKARARIRGGDRAADLEARVVRRRPPLDVDVNVRLEPRDDALVQTFAIDCRAAAGLDSLVVDFAEPGGDALAWRVDEPAGVTATARPLEPAEGGLAARSDAIAASWLVELNPAVSGTVRLRAVRSVPFAAAVPVPLAWVEGAMQPGGTVVVAATPGARPRVANRRLRELPADPAAAAPADEYAYGAPSPGAAAEIAPAAADARAWAWRETVSCWCDESGSTECESRFDVQNEGRRSLALSLAPGRRLESVLIDGIAPTGVEFGPAGGTWRIPLPEGRRRPEIVVRTLDAGRPGRGGWRVDPLGCGLDVPVLDREARLLLPPDLVLATVAADGETMRLPWMARLFGVGGDASRPGAETPNGFRTDAPSGFRAEAVAPLQEGGGVFVVRGRLLVGGAILAAVGAGLFAFLRGRRSPGAACAIAVVPAVAALWLPAAFVPVARAAWWGALAGLAWALAGRFASRRVFWRPGAVTAAACVAALLLPRPLAGADPGVRVFVTPGDGGDTALVPEPLFRAIGAFAAPESAAIRVCGCRVTAGRRDGRAEWAIAIDVDADAGGAIVLDAGPGARWLPPRGAAPGLGATLVSDREVRLTAASAGRQTVDLDLVPAFERRGPLEFETARIPLAPVAALRLADDTAAGGLQCERALGDEAFTRAAVVGTAFDVSAADRVRLVRPVDPRDRLAATVRAAETSNDLACDAGGCAVQAAFDVDVGPELLRAIVVRADERLVGLAVPAGAPAARLVPLGGGRMLVELPEATRGRVAVRLAARLPLADPVGVFSVPGVWLEGVPAEQRTIRLTAATEFDATLDPPPAAGVTAADAASRQPTRVIVRRRRPQVRAAQSLAVAFGPTGVSLTLEAQIDASDLALARIPIDVPIGCSIDHVAFLADDPADPAARAPVDVSWTRAAADRVLLVVQRPRQGRFRLEVEARLARRPAARGRLPLLRGQLGAEAPLLVSCSAEPPLTVRLLGAEGAPRPDVVELPEGAAEPEYALTLAEEPAAPGPPAAVAEQESRVESAEVRAAFGARGRVHGLARFDVVGAASVVRLRLPPGMRLFDVLVDGHSVAAEPRAADAWDVPLGAAGWPRTILAVFAGDAGRAVVDGRPLALAAPLLEGLSTPEVLWSLRPPPGFVLKVAPPARPLDATAFAAARAAARQRVAAACDRVAAGAAGAERERLEAVAALRRADRGPAAEEAWWDSGRDPAEQGSAVVAAEAPLVIRAVPAGDATTPARAAATVVLVAFGGLAWTAAARLRAARSGASA